MSNSFEEAMNQGFSRYELAQEEKEILERMNDLGCKNCKYSSRVSKVCGEIIDDYDGIYPKCPYFKRGENT